MRIRLIVAACMAFAADGSVAAAEAASTACVPTAGGPAALRDVPAALDRLRPLLTGPQRAALDRPLQESSAIQWSNLPIGVVPRAGLRLGDLDERQATAAREVFTAVLSDCGLRMLDEVRLADDYLAPLDKRPIGWHGGNYYLSVLGDSTSKAPWLLQLGGHHLAYNFAFNARESGATPMFVGSEPIHFEMQGRPIEPLQAQSTALSRLAQAISPQPKARLSGTFTDVVKGVVVTGTPGGPISGGIDSGFPHEYPTGETDRGILAGSLPDAQRELVRAAIASFAQLPDAAISGALLEGYLAPQALDDTYVGFAGSPDLATQGSYVRIDGPRVWIELVVQRAIALPDQLHYHALWRDKQSDYGGAVKR